MRMRWICLLLSISLVAGFPLCTSAASHPFTDVPENAWYEDSVEYVYTHGLMSGTSDSSFSPNATMTRAMTVTVLYRLAGSPQTAGENPFSDVAETAYYYEAVKWAAETGVTSGTSAVTFSPDDSVTRQQLVTFLYRYASSLDVGMSYRLSSLTGFVDVELVSTYALVPFAWSVSNGIIAGTDLTHLSAHERATRAQCAAILTRFVLLIQACQGG